MVIRPQKTAEIGNKVLFYMVYTKCAIGTVVKHKDIRGISYKNNSLGWYPANGQDSGIIGKVISIMGDL